MAANNVIKERIVRISRRPSIKWWQRLIIIASAILVAFLMCGVISTIAAPGTFFEFYQLFFEGPFVSGDAFLVVLWNAALLFLIAVALTPVFKMKFWNIGAEGQCLMGGLGAMIGLYFVAPHVPLFLALIIELALAMIFAVGWAVIPTIFKAFFNTNETLFTLMMNYIAAALVWAFELTFKNNSTGTIDELYRTEHYGWIPIIDKFNNSYIINIIIIVLVAVLVWVYLRFSKHGYELSVVGGSQNTARYVGINVKKVVIRTVILTGIICGVVGFLIVPGSAHTIAHESVGGRGFTAILICWISGFSIPAMGFYSFLINFVSTGCKDASKWLPYSDKLGNICVALFFVALLISTFFINFRVSIRWPKPIKKFFDKIKGLFKKKKKPDEVETVPNEGLAMKNVEFTSEIVDTITEDTKKEEEE